MSQTRASNYKGHRIVVEVSWRNTVYVTVHAPDGTRLFKKQIQPASLRFSSKEFETSSYGVSRLKNGARERGLILEAWKQSRQFVDEQVCLKEALNHVAPEWELE